VIKHKFELDLFKHKIFNEVENLKNFEERANELRDRIQNQKKNLLKFHENLIGHEKFCKSNLLFGKMRMMRGEQ
jgi:hypothetical protein